MNWIEQALGNEETMGKLYTNHELKAILQMYRDSVSVTEMCQKLGRNEGSIRGKLKDIKRRRARGQLTELEKSYLKVSA